MHNQVLLFWLWCGNEFVLAPTDVTNLAVIGVTPTSIEISWSPPHHARDRGSIVLTLHFLIFRVYLCYRESSDLLPH